MNDYHHMDLLRPILSIISAEDKWQAGIVEHFFACIVLEASI
jgi:hypothetical protein